jgi:hypothetical protein
MWWQTKAPAVKGPFEPSPGGFRAVRSQTGAQAIGRPAAPSLRRDPGDREPAPFTAVRSRPPPPRGLSIVGSQ